MLKLPLTSVLKGMHFLKSQTYLIFALLDNNIATIQESRDSNAFVKLQ